MFTPTRRSCDEENARWLGARKLRRAAGSVEGGPVPTRAVGRESGTATSSNMAGSPSIELVV